MDGDASSCWAKAAEGTSPRTDDAMMAIEVERVKRRGLNGFSYVTMQR
jgi:hypothetical protein